MLNSGGFIEPWHGNTAITSAAGTLIGATPTKASSDCIAQVGAKRCGVAIEVWAVEVTRLRTVTGLKPFLGFPTLKPGLTLFIRFAGTSDKGCLDGVFGQFILEFLVFLFGFCCVVRRY